jgi:hypothetical protein
MSARTLAGALLLLLAAHAPARAQRVTVELLGAVEGWKTDAGSRLLARNDGDPMAVAQLYGFGLLRLTRITELRVVTEAVAGTADDEDAELALELLALKIAPSRAVTLEGGRILMPVGGFGIRHFPNTNPLIGSPDLYPPQYPWGVVAAGGLGTFDYAIGAVSLPVVNPRYSPEPGDRLRPVLRVGYTPSPAFRIGAAITRGPYLGPASSDRMPANTEWQDFSQTVIASDVRFSIGYVDARAEIAWSSYEVPTLADDVNGLGAYAEARIAHSPRIFSALRVERFRYPFIRAVSATTWIGAPVTQYNAEAGVGYRLGPSALAKLSYRRDYWPGNVRPGAPPAPDGYALAIQLSMLVDIGEMLEPRY